MWPLEEPVHLLGHAEHVEARNLEGEQPERHGQGVALVVRITADPGLVAPCEREVHLPTLEQGLPVGSLQQVSQQPLHLRRREGSVSRLQDLDAPVLPHTRWTSAAEQQVGCGELEQPIEGLLDGPHSRPNVRWNRPGA